MKDLMVGIAIGIILGAIAVYAYSSATKSEAEAGMCPAAALDQKTIESVTKKLNNLIHESNPEVNVRITKFVPYGEVYRITIEFYNSTNVLTANDYYLTSNGSILFTNQIDLSRLSEEPGRVNVSADDDPYRGAENAKVVVVEFSDFACPYCAKFATEVEPRIIKDYGDKVKIVFRDFPVHGEISITAAEAANCAGEQGKYWEFHDLLFEKQEEWMVNKSKLNEYAEQLGLNVTAFSACIESGKYRDEISKDYYDGVSYGVTGTPTFFINGKRVVGYLSYEQFSTLIRQELESQS